MFAATARAACDHRRRRLLLARDGQQRFVVERASRRVLMPRPRPCARAGSRSRTGSETRPARRPPSSRGRDRARRARRRARRSDSRRCRARRRSTADTRAADPSAPAPPPARAPASTAACRTCASGCAAAAAGTTSPAGRRAEQCVARRSVIAAGDRRARAPASSAPSVDGLLRLDQARLRGRAFGVGARRLGARAAAGCRRACAPSRASTFAAIDIGLRARPRLAAPPTTLRNACADGALHVEARQRFAGARPSHAPPRHWRRSRAADRSRTAPRRTARRPRCPRRSAAGRRRQHRTGHRGDHRLRQHLAEDVVGGAAVRLPERIEPRQIRRSRDVDAGVDALTCSSAARTAG